MDNIQKWQDNKDLRTKAFDLLKHILLKKELYSLDELNDLVKKREQALFICLCWQQILRDAHWKKLKAIDHIIHQDQKELLNILEQTSATTLDIFFQKMVQLEQDIKGYTDSPLGFDNLCSAYFD